LQRSQIGLNLKYRNAPVMEHQDQKYIDALINNDSTLQQEIYNKFSADIKCLVLQNNGSEADAGDLFQEGLVFIYKKAKSGKFTLTCPFGAFLYAVCRNKWLNELTKRKHAQVTLKEIQKYNNVNEDSFHSSDEIYLQQARKDLLLAKLSEMDEVCKKILFLSWNGKTMKQVARLLNLSYGYARKKKCECMAELVIAIEQSTEYNSLKW
jgi:RNA polymerase sigma factor (sigma-70 family)